MSRTIPRHLPNIPGPRGERKAMCDRCGIFWYRSQLRRMPDGMLWCPDDTGRDAVTLDRANAQAALSIRGTRPPPERW